MSVNVTISSTAPQASAGSDKTACIIGKTTGYVGTPVIENVTSTASLGDTLGDDATISDALTTSLDAFFSGKSAGGGSTNLGVTVALYNAVEVDDASKVPVKEDWAKDTYTYNVPDSPVESMDTLYLKWGTAYVTQVAAAWEATQDDNDIYTGEVVFDQDVGDSPWTIDGSTYIDPADVNSDNEYTLGDDTNTINGLFADYSLNRLQALLSELQDHDINVFAFSYDCTRAGMAAANTYSLSSLASDYMAAKYHAAASYSGLTPRPRQFVGALPAGTEPNDTDAGYGFDTTLNYTSWMDLIGGKDVTIIQHDVTTENDVATSDPAAFFMGKYVSRSVFKEGFLFDDWGSFPQASFPTLIQKKSWDGARIACVFKDPSSFVVKMLSVGYTFGASPYDRVESVRCIYWIVRHSVAALKTLLASREAYITLDGCNRAVTALENTVRMGIELGVCDGIASMNFPLRDAFRNRGDTLAEERITSAKTSKSLGQITMSIDFAGNVEDITLNVGFS